MNKTKEKIFIIFNSVWVMPALFSVAFLFWALDLSDVAVGIFALFVVLNLLLFDDIKPIFVPVLYVHFYINNIYFSSHWLAYGICIGVGVLAFVYYIIKQLVKRGKTLKKGKLFWAIVAADAAFLLAGVLGRFNLLVCVITLGFSLVIYFFYWVAINFCQNLREYLLNLFVIGGLFVGAQLLYSLIGTGDFLNAIATREIFNIGAQNINTAALFFGISLIAAFAKGKGNKRDFLYFLAACFFALMVFLTYCRMMIALAFVAGVIFTVNMFKKSDNKRIFLVFFTAVLVVAIGLVTIFFKETVELVESFMARFISSGDMGRREIWSWSWERFLEYPVFGYGFVSEGVIPTLNPATRVILSHNTLLQYLTSLGVVGTLAMGFFYFKKYQLMFKNFSFSDFFVVGMIILIELSGLVDQSATMDFFVVTITILLLAIIEKDKEPNEKIEEKRRREVLEK